MKTSLESVLGLSKNEAKVYSAILEHGNCETNTLAEITGLPRTRIYDILSKLTAKTLLEKDKNGSKGYQLIPPHESIDMVLNQIKSEYDFKERAIKELGNHLQTVYSNGIGSELTPGVTILEFRDAEAIILQQLRKVEDRVFIAVSTDTRPIDMRKSATILASSYTTKLDFRYLVSSAELTQRLKTAVTSFPGFADMELKFGCNENLYASFILLDDTIFLFFLGQQDATDLKTLVLMTGSSGLVKSFEWMFTNLWTEIK
ncbi:MAG: TrmB family transcriptional regulator [Candidatus Kariarchaeaceae archaeon]